MSKPQRVIVSPTSPDNQTAETFVAGDAESAAVPVEAVEARVGPKKAAGRGSKVKPCVRCEERRAREREYAKSSRLRLRLAAGEKAAPSGSVETTSASDAGGPNESAQTTPPL